MSQKTPANNARAEWPFVCRVVPVHTPRPAAHCVKAQLAPFERETLFQLVVPARGMVPSAFPLLFRSGRILRKGGVWEKEQPPTFLSELLHRGTARETR
jgi:hypothetical protein